MGVLITLVTAINYVISALLNVYFFIVLIACVISWVNPDPYNPIVRALRNLTEPVFWRIRKFMPFVVIGGLDLSPVVLLIGLKALEILVSGLLAQLMFALA